MVAPTPPKRQRPPGWLPAAVLTAAVTLAIHLCTSFGLVVSAPEWITPFLVGAVAAVVCEGAWASAGAGAAAGALVGFLVSPPWSVDPAGPGGLAGQAVLFVVVAALSAAAVSWLGGRARRLSHGRWIVPSALVAVIIGTMWLTALQVDSTAIPPADTSLAQQLAAKPELGQTTGDDQVYLRLFYDVHDGKDYYSSVAAIWKADSSDGFHLPFGASSYRLPTIFYLWRLLPPDGDALPWAFLAFASLAVVSAFLIGAQLARPGPAVAGALFVAVAYLYVATTTYVTYVDAWAMALTLAALAISVASFKRDDVRLVWAAAVVALMAALMRELLVYPMVLAALAALFLPKKERLRAALPWLAGLLAFGVGYAAHVAAIAGRVDKQVGYSWWQQGGVQHFIATLRFFEAYFGGKPFLLPALVLAGVVGAVLLRKRDRRLSAFLAACSAAPLVMFLFFGNGGQIVVIENGKAHVAGVVGYWGMLVVPIALALAPVALDRVLGALGLPEAPAPERVEDPLLARLRRIA